MPGTSTRRAGWSASATSSCNAGVGTTPTHGVVVVVGNSGVTVDVTNVTTFGAVNTD